MRTTLLCLSLCAGTIASAQDLSPAQARKELVSTIRTQTVDHRTVMKDAYASLNAELKQIEADAKSGSATADDIARDVHSALVDYVGLMKTLTAYVASQVSVEAGSILNDLPSSPEYPVFFSTGSGRDLDKGLEKLERANASFAKKAARRTTATTKKLAKLGFELTVRTVDDLPVGIAPNPEFSYTSLNFDTLIDVVVGCSRSDALSDGTLVVGGISNPAKGGDVSVQINGVGGIEFTVATTITGDRWVTVFDSEGQPLPEGNYRIIAIHGSTRVGTTLGLR